MGMTTRPDGFSAPRWRVVWKEKVPWLPFTSGTHIPESNTPENFSGGKVIGTRITEQKTPASPRKCQKGLAFLRSLIRGLRSEEHTSELQSLAYLVCRLLLEKKNHP